MARLESRALAGYYATPTHLLPRIAHLFVPPNLPKRPDYGDPGYYSFQHRHITFCDPCAADGAAVLGLMSELGIPDARDYLYACELEKSRYDALHQAVGYNNSRTVKGDAFRVTFSRDAQHEGVACLYLNPPYDQDRGFKRLEARFLSRSTPVLVAGGVLVFLVPHYALASCAEHLATHYRDVRCFRFPGTDFDAFKQVVLVAKRSETLLAPDPAILDRVLQWSSSAAGMRELPDEPTPLYSLPHQHHGGLSEWSMRAADVTAILADFKPWHAQVRKNAVAPIPGMLPEVPLQDLLLRTYPVATPPRPAHIAAGIASGIFNGARIVPDRGRLPDLLIKGCFDREWRTVEEKQNKDGEIVGEVQVQQPKLVTTVLDLREHTYHTLPSGTEATGSQRVDEMNVADILQHYGTSLMGVMERQCPVLYDPRDPDDASIALHESPRELYAAQKHATRALVKLLGERDRTALFLGEIGVGKSTCSLVAARSVGAERVLIFCPPHLLDSWKEQVAAIAPDMATIVLRDVTDLSRLPPAPFVAILSRETAKLTHGWAGASVCPKCGTVPAESPETLAKKRSRCDHRRLRARDASAKAVVALAQRLQPYAPHDVYGVLRGRLDRIAQAKAPRDDGYVPPLELAGLADALLKDPEQTQIKPLVFALHAIGDADLTWEVIWRLRAQGLKDAARTVLYLLGPDAMEAAVVRKESHEKPAPSWWAEIRGDEPYKADLGWDWKQIRADAECLKKGETVEKHGLGKFSWTDGKLTLDDAPAGSLAAAVRTMRLATEVSDFAFGKECGEFLFQATPDPARIALAKHIVKYHRHSFDFFICDEAHEASADSAQGFAAHRLVGLKLPTIAMTGSVMNGYVDSFFSNMWALSSDFRSEFGRDDRTRFVDRFGYRKRLVQDRDGEGTVVEFGSQSDRVVRNEKMIGDAPGILPLFLLRHLLPISVTLHKADLAIDLPKCTMHKHLVEPDEYQRRRYERLKTSLVNAIRADMFEEGRAGKLFGQLAELPSYLDRATRDVGNCESGAYEIRYPESLDRELVATEDGLPADSILPKEAWMLRTLKEQLADGRNVMVFSWHVSLLPRLARLISAETEAVILYADKVPTAKRQAWIEREIVKKRRRVLVTNPVAIQTGLNNLVHFASEIWMENPACNPLTYRQAVGRIDRIGQRLPTEIHFPIYADTLQENLYDLLMHKVAVSVGADGLDNESALAAAGLDVGNYLAGLSIGRQLWAMIGGVGAEGRAA